MRGGGRGASVGTPGRRALEQERDTDGGSSARCWACDHPLDTEDHYCRSCGQGQGAFLTWYYRPLWIILLALTALGPFALPLVWRTPSLDRSAKWVASLAILALTAYVGWELAVTLQELAGVLSP